MVATAFVMMRKDREVLGSHGAQKGLAAVAVQVRQQFRPEFINRIDEFIVFQALDKLQIAQIVRLQVRKD